MKKVGMLNSEITEVIAKMGHTDMIAIGDCGLPIPECTKRIDLALTNGVPGFTQTLEIVLKDLEIEEIILAKEIIDINSKVYEDIKNLVGNTKITFISHEELKYNLKSCKAVIRTGEQTPYANIILKSGVIF